MKKCGLNKYLIEMANIRNQDSWVHSGTPAEATDKARELVQMAVARAATLYPLQEKKISVIQRALVIGGGIAGMNAALGLADQGFEVVLLEKEEQLGGLATQLTATIEGANIGDYLQGLIQKVTSHPKIQVLTQSLVVGFSGFKGNFTTELLVGPGMYARKIEHGVVILATGAKEYQPKEFLYGENERVMTQIELARRLNEKGAGDLKQVVMIQCVGSRNEENPNCSRICCQTAVKNALHIKEENPDAQVFILYRDIRTYGLLEDYYKKAREQGVLFFRFSAEEPPRVESSENGVMVTFKDHILNRDLKVESDLLCLSAGMVAEDTEELSAILKTRPHCGRIFHGSPCQIATGGYGHRRNLCMRHSPQSQTDLRIHFPGPGSRRPRHHLSLPKPADPVGGNGQGDSGAMRILPGVRPILPVQCTADQRRRRQ